MGTVTVTVELPEEIAEKAERAGILEMKSIVRLLEAEIERQRKLDEFFKLLDELQADPDKPTEEEIMEEVRQYRAEKRQKRAAELAAQQSA